MKNILILFFLVLPVITGFAQNEQEKILIEKLAVAKADTTKVRIMKALGIAFMNTNPELSKYYAEKCIALSQKAGIKEGEANGYNCLGSYHFNKGNYLKATESYLESLRLYKELDDKRKIAMVYNNLGSMNMKQGNLEEAKSNLSMSIQLKEELNIEKGLPNCYQTLGSIYYFENDLDKALIYFEKGVKISRKMEDQRVESACLNGASAVQFKKGNYDAAIKGYKQALELAKSHGGDNKRAISGFYHNIAEAYRKQGKYDEAIKLLHESLKLAKEINSHEDIKQAYAGLSDYYKAKGDLSNALIAKEYYSVYKDSVINESTLKSINELQEKYKSEERKKEISDLQYQNGELETKSTLQYSLLIVSVGALLVTILAIFFYLKQIKARQQKKQAELEQKALRAQMNPHFIFNSLNSIQRMYIEGKEDIANDYMADFSRLLRSILENSGQDLIRLKEELDVLKLYMDLEALRTDHSFEYICEIAEEIDPLLIKIPPLIFQPYLENAIWHGIIAKNDLGIIRLNIQKAQPGKLICEITDNGVGFYSSKKSQTAKENESRGMQITAERLGGENNVVIEELATGGTKITLTIQYTA